MSAAYRSALDLSFDVRAGLVMRQIHHWAALLFIAAIVMHLCRVFFTGAFRRPREINWIVGVTLLVLAIANGFFGYSLLDDLLSGTGLRVAYSIALSIPIAGDVARLPVLRRRVPRQRHDPALLRAARADPARADRRAARARTWPSLAPEAHAVPGPGTHGAQHRGLAAVARPTRSSRSACSSSSPPCSPRSAASRRSTPSGSTARSTPATVSSGSQPDWYVGWLDGALRLMPGWEIRAFGQRCPTLLSRRAPAPG